MTVTMREGVGGPLELQVHEYKLCVHEAVNLNSELTR